MTPMIPSFSETLFFLTKSPVRVFLFLGLLIAIMYGKTLRFDFVSYDDDYHVYNNLSIRELTPAATAEIFTGKVRIAGDHEAQIYANRIYIPVTFLTFQLQHALTGLNPLWFHAGNVFLFMLIAFSAYALFCLWLKHPPAALLCAILFAVHPLNAEPTAWISGRKDLLCDLFFMLGLLSYTHYSVHLKPRSLALTMLWCALSTLSKPSAGIFIAVLLAYDFIFRRALSWKRILAEKIPLLLAVLIPVAYSVLHYALQDNRLISSQRLFFSLGTPLFALGHAFFPFSLSGFYPYPPLLVWEWPQIFLMVGGVLGAALLWLSAKKEPPLRAFAGTLFTLTLLPYVLRGAFFSDGGFTSDRYMLLPLLGLFLLLGLLLKKTFLCWPEKNPLQKTSVLLTGLLLTGCFALNAYNRSTVWTNSETLALDIVKKYPLAANAQEELGRIYQFRGLRTKAAEHFKAAYFADPKMRRLIQLYEFFGLTQPLISLYQEALKTAPHDSRLRAGLGLVYFRTKQFSLAEKNLAAALEADKQNYQLYNALAGALYYQNKIPQAIALWKQALTLNPNDTSAANNLGAAYLASGNHEEAGSLFKKVLSIDPNHKSARSNLDKLLTRT